MSLDTHPEARRVQIELMCQAPPWRKMELLGQLNHMAKLFALSGLRTRHPHASEREIRRRLADLILGEELAAEVYGPLEPGTEDAGAE